MLIKDCPCCGKVKLVSEFYPNKNQKDGLQPYCKVCVNKHQENYTKSDEAVEQSKRSKLPKHLYSIKTRAIQKGLAFDLESEDVVYPEYCPVLKLKLETGSARRGLCKNSASVDRIDPAKGYVKGNIQVMSMLANKMKQDATPEQLLMFADWIYKTYQK
jgi:hypothetical protein